MPRSICKIARRVFILLCCLTPSAVVGQVYVTGEVVRPGGYRVGPAARLEAALQMAGGVRAYGSERDIQLRRAGGAAQHVDLLRFRLFGESAHNPLVWDGDVIYVPLRERAVTILGSVRRPGIYELRREQSVEALVALAGGRTAGAAERRVEMARVEKGKHVLTPVHVGLRDGDVVYIPKRENDTLDLSTVPFPDEASAAPFQEQFVYTVGGVKNPGPYPYTPYATAGHYIAQAGGLTRRAKVNRVQLVHVDGSKKRISYSGHIRPLPGETIRVPERHLSGSGWARIIIGVVGLGLSATATALALGQ